MITYTMLLKEEWKYLKNKEINHILKGILNKGNFLDTKVFL